MNKFDLVERFSFWDLLTASLKTPREPYWLLKEAGIIKGQWYPYYFNWGRNALFFLFKKLPFKKISFPAFTCPTLTEAATAAGKKINLLEINLQTFNLDIKKLKSKEIECLVVVHTFGYPLEIRKIRKILPQTFIIEDCAHSLFSRVNNEYMGSQGDIILFSLYKQTPNINAALLLSKKRFKLKQEEESLLHYPKRVLVKTKGIHQLWLNQWRKKYLPEIEQFCYSEDRPNKITFVLFEKYFSKLKKEVDKRRKVSYFFEEEFSDSPFFSCQKERDGVYPSFYQFPIFLKKPFVQHRDRLGLFLREKNIFVDRLWFEAPITQKKFKKFQKTCPKALYLAKSVLSLPIRGDYKRKDVRQRRRQINAFFQTIG